MLRPMCDICRRNCEGDITQREHYCERCLPFADEFRSQLAEASRVAWLEMGKSLERFRNEFIRDVVNRKKLEIAK